jgi:hypothetical protein
MIIDDKKKDQLRGHEVKVTKADESVEHGIVTLFDDGGIWLRSDADSSFIEYNDIKDITIREKPIETTEGADKIVSWKDGKLYEHKPEEKKRLFDRFRKK